MNYGIRKSQYGSANYDFGFLDNYINSINRPSRTNPDQVVEGEGFYEEVDEDTEGQQGDESFYEEEVQQPLEDSFEEQAMNAYLLGDESQHDQLISELTNYQYDFANAATDAGEDETGRDGNPPTGGTLGSQISKIESGGNYKATNPNSSATGKYQFLWGSWGDSIKKVTGVKTQQEFLNNPQAQEKYYSYYEQNYLLPEVQKIRKEIKTGLSDTQLAKLIHFRGEGGARKYLRGELKDKPESYNIPISKYIKQTGGVAVTPSAQRIGLNNPSFSSMVLPLTGQNVIRGLDDGSPVYVEDEYGTNQVLFGPQDTTVMRGTVYEKRVPKPKRIK